MNGQIPAISLCDNPQCRFRFRFTRFVTAIVSILIRFKTQQRIANVNLDSMPCQRFPLQSDGDTLGKRHNPRTKLSQARRIGGQRRSVAKRLAHARMRFAQNGRIVVSIGPHPKACAIFAEQFGNPLATCLSELPNPHDSDIAQSTRRRTADVEQIRYGQMPNLLAETLIRDIRHSIGLFHIRPELGKDFVKTHANRYRNIEYALDIGSYRFGEFFGRCTMSHVIG